MMMRSGKGSKSKVLLVAEHQLYRAMLAHLLTCSLSIEVAGEAADVAQAVRQWRCLRPDLVLMDSSDREEELDGLLTLHKQIRGTPLLVLSSGSTPALRPLLAGGLAGCLLKSARPEELLAAIRRLQQGERVIDPRIAERVFDTTFRERQRRSKDGSELSLREEQVLRCIARGFTNPEIARHLRLGLKTVETYRSRLCKKLGLRTRSDLVMYASASGLIPSSHSEN